MVGSDTSLATIAAAAVFRVTKPNQTTDGDQRAASTHERRSTYSHGRGPTPDVGGPVLSVQETTPTDHQRRTRNDGIWTAGGDRRTARLTQSTGRRCRWRRRISNDKPGAGDGGAI